MRLALQAFRKDLSRWRRDWVATLVWLAIPLMIGGLITSMMASGVQPHGVLLLVDEDETFLSELIVGAYSAGELGELISVEKTAYAEGIARVNDGDASGLLVIPEGFAAAFLESTPVTLQLRTNPAQTILPGIIRDVTEILLDAGFYAHELFGDEIATITSMTSDPSDAEIAAVAVAIRGRIDSVAPRLLPPLIEIEIVEPPAEEPAPPLALLFMPGIILMAVVISANGLALDFWHEREQGTLRRLVCTPAQIASFVVGKALASAAVIGVVAGITLVLGFAYHGIAWSELPSALLWLVVSGMALFTGFSALQMLFSTRNAASVFSMVLVFPLLMAGGSFFPLAIMPDWMATIGRASPNGAIAERLTREITTAGPWSIDPLSWLVTLLLAGLGVAICTWRLQTGFARQ